MRVFHVVMALALAAVTLISVGMTPNVAHAAPGDIVVGDQYPCTRDGLASAIADIQPGATISFDCTSPRIDFFAGDTITIDKVLNIDGYNNGNQIILDGHNQTNFFVIEPTGYLFLNGIVLQHGAAPRNADGFYQGGAIDNMGNLYISDTTFRENRSAEYGGAISSSGFLNITRSTFIFNSAAVHGGALDLNGFLGYIENTTFSGNTASETGSAINVHPGTTTVLLWLTIVQPQNTSPALATSPYIPLPGAPPTNPPPTPAQLYITGILLGGYGQHCAFQRDSLVVFASSLANDDSCQPGQTADWENQDLNLGALQQFTHNGVFVGIHPLIVPSPAIPTGPQVGCVYMDQLGTVRPSSPFCTTGAVESVIEQTMTLCANSWTGAVTLPARGDCGRSETTLEVPTYFDSNFCVNTWNGALRSGDQCSRSEYPLTISGNPTVDMCVNRWNGAVRIGTQCTRSEYQKQY